MRVTRSASWPLYRTQSHELLIKGDNKVPENGDIKSDEENQGNAKDIQFHVSPELEYVYRDVFNVYVGAGDVLIEFGNIHRSMPEHASISNRIVMSIGNAYSMMQTMQQALQQAHDRLQKNLQKKS